MRTSNIGQLGGFERNGKKRQEQSGKVFGKIAFYRDTEVQEHAVERIMGKWVGDFHSQLAQYCVRKPRYSELRPLKFMHRD